VPGAREWMGGLMLRAPAPLKRLRDVPVVGNWIHRLSHSVLPSEGLVWAQVQAGPARGLWLELNPRTGQSYLRGEAEATVLNAVAERLQAGMTFYDLGANIGLFSLTVARIVGANGRVVSFEPDPLVARRLRRNVERNGFANVTVVEAGIWSSSGEVEFAAADASSPDRGVGRILHGAGGGGVSASGAGRAGVSGGTTIRCVALDDFTGPGAQGLAAPLPDAIKCDVEGAEVEALHGAERLLAMRRAWIVCEMHSRENDEAARELLGRFGYACETVDELHLLAVPGAKG
jgi:FkbM family methyltransferase